MTDKGYGVDLTHLRWKPNANVLAMDLFGMQNETIREAFLDFCKDEEMDPDSEEAKEAFVEDYEENMHCWSGIEAIISVCVNDAKLNGNDWLGVEDDYLYFTACIPISEESKQLIPTQEDIRRYFAEYLEPLLEEPTEVKWVYPLEH